MKNNNYRVRENAQLTKILANAPKGEYYLYTDMAQALGNAAQVSDANVSVAGCVALREKSFPSAEVLELLAETSETSARRGDYIDIFANAAAEEQTSVVLGNDERANVNVAALEGFDGISVARLVISVPAMVKAAAVVHVSSCGRLVLQTKVNVGKGANLTLVLLQDGESDKVLLTRTTIDMDADSSADISFVNLNPALARNEIRCGLHAQGANLRMGGIYTVADGGRVDNESLVEHLAGHTQSDQLFKGIADADGVMAFGGLILVKPDAQKVDANQTNRHMLASRDARAYAKPQLEIYADDVKCSHGATTGQIDPQQLFYMQQRGIDERTARKLLSAAFVGEVVDRIPLEDVRTSLHEKLIG